MGNKSTQVDPYIAKAARFAQPIPRRLRKAVHAGCPEVEETIKWGSLFFETAVKWMAEGKSLNWKHVRK